MFSLLFGLIKLAIVLGLGAAVNEGIYVYTGKRLVDGDALRSLIG